MVHTALSLYLVFLQKDKQEIKHNLQDQIKYAIFFSGGTNDSLKIYEDGDWKGDYCDDSCGYSPNDLFE